MAARLAFFLILTAGSPLDQNRLVAEAAQGHVDNVQAILSRFPNAVNSRQRGVTALQAASNKGHSTVVGLLLAAGADPTIADDDGDNTLHYAAYGNEPAILAGLLRVSPNSINAVNKAGQTPLHIAVIRQSEHCVAVLLKLACNVNIQDVDGDTALHEAVIRINMAIVALLISVGGIDLKLKNSQGFNVVHMAALKGNQIALAFLLVKVPSTVVNEPTSDGVTALHIAALNGYPLTAATLINQGKANLEAKTSDEQTPLQLAVINGQIPVIELLVLKGAKLEVEDSDGDTALHNVLNIFKSSQQQPTTFMAFLFKNLFHVQPKDIQHSTHIYQIFQAFDDSTSVPLAWVAVACFLISKGADLHHKNKNGRTPLDEVDSPQIRNMLLKIKVL